MGCLRSHIHGQSMFIKKLIMYFERLSDVMQSTRMREDVVGWGGG